MSELKEALDKLSLSGGISNQWPRFTLKWAEQNAGFDIFDLTDKRGGKLAIGDDADYLHLFMAMADQVFKPGEDHGKLLIASDAGGNRLFAKFFTVEEKEQFKYAYIALGHAASRLPESAVNGRFSFFGETTLEKGSAEGFEIEARKAARTMSEGVKAVWQQVVEQKSDFIKTDLYVFQLLKLYSWGFKVLGRDEGSSSDYQFVRAKRPQPRGAVRN